MEDSSKLQFSYQGEIHSQQDEDHSRDLISKPTIKMPDISSLLEIKIQEVKEKQTYQIQEELNQTHTLIRIPFYTNSQQKLNKILTTQIIQKVQEKQDCINLSLYNPNKTTFNVNIFKKKLIRPMQILKVKKLINKKTGKTIKIIKKASNIDLLYDYEQLGDFINTQGSETLYNEKRYSIKQEDILSEIKKFLTEKVHSKDQTDFEPSANDNYLPLIQPLFYLKSYNFVPPSCDMLINKIKPKFEENLHAVAKSINYEEQIPSPPNIQAPRTIAESELYKKITSYLEKRPCWLRNSLYYALNQDGMKDKFTVNDFKNVMKYTAFTYRNGPWKHTFCKFGFDPKKEFKSIIFQSIAIKLKQKQVEDYGNEVEEDVYDPTFQQISNRFIRSYQLCDIANETIREIVQGKLISKEGECNKEHGWLNSTQHGKIMKTMKLRIQQTVKNS